MKVIVYILFVSLLSGCLPTSSVVKTRPDKLSFPSLQFHFPEVYREQLNNGARLYVKEDHELPLVNLTLMVEGGSIYDPLDKTGLSSLFARTLATGGTRSLPADEVEQELETMAAELSAESGLYGYTINLAVHRDDLKRSLEILTDLLRAPAFSADRFELARQQMIEGVRRQNDEPGGIAQRLLDETLVGQHPLGASATEATINGITREDLLEIHEKYFHPANFWFAVSGDVKLNQIEHQLEGLLGDWPSGDSLLREIPSMPEAPAGQILTVDKEIPQTTILIGHGGISKDNPDQYALQVANYILGGGGFNSRLMREVRSNRGLAYSVYSYFQVGRYLPGFFIAGSETKSASTPEVVGLMLKLIKQIRSEPVSGAELDLAKQSLINSFVFAFDNTHSVVARQVRLDYFDYPSDYLEQYKQHISEVTIADVQRVCQQYLHPEMLQVVLVGNTATYAEGLKPLGLPISSVEP